MLLPLNSLDKMKSQTIEFHEDDSGRGVAEYGAILALLMILGGVGAGWYVFSNQSSCSTTTMKTLNGDAPAAPRQRIPCGGCGMG